MKFSRAKLCVECDEVFEEESQCPSCMCSSYIFPAKILQINETVINDKFYKLKEYNEEDKKKWEEEYNKPWNIKSIIEASKS